MATSTILLLAVSLPSVFGYYEWVKISKQNYGLWAPDLWRKWPIGYYDSIYGDYFFFHLNELDSYRDPSDNKFHFKLVQKRIRQIQPPMELNPPQSIELKWSQSSWILEDEVVGFEQDEPFPEIDPDVTWGNGVPFDGLAKSEYWGCNVGSSPRSAGYNCVGCGTSQGPGMICYGAYYCGGMELYVRQTVPVTCSDGCEILYSQEFQPNPSIQIRDEMRYSFDIEIVGIPAGGGNSGGGDAPLWIGNSRFDRYGVFFVTPDKLVFEFESGSNPYWPWSITQYEYNGDIEEGQTYSVELLIKNSEGLYELRIDDGSGCPTIIEGSDKPFTNGIASNAAQLVNVENSPDAQNHPTGGQKYQILLLKDVEI
eukprot:CAMPEP_0201565936 /NCGR_PEP_ID=MMETSP0190_2-20130828/5384_1 /ASSEMBLY_ACC=CAM_ASM_000263 /TAXON_ID=37353 /ORGANISM="Rosalina sp." /LENGTH=367 /DNA_ID=CAMNT_0047984009 /DNA_START=43 /DNA_END=1147 /DNA_ORIENTATION=+